MSARRSRRRTPPTPPTGRWSWHRLDEPFAEQLVAASRVRPGELILDLGAGDGAITAHLVGRGARVIAFELHPGRSAELRSRFGERVRVVQADVRDLRLPRRPFRVVANPPFDGVSAILDRLTAPHSRLVRADLVLPLSVARRWADRLDGRPHRPFRLAVSRRLPRTAFDPPPRIDTCIVTIGAVGRRR